MRTSKIYEIGKDNLQELLEESNTYGEVLNKIGLSVIANNFKTLNKYIELWNLSTETIEKNRRKAMSHIKYTEGVFKKSLEDGTCTLSPSKTLKKIIQYGLKEYKCEKCGVSSWNGNDIILELHHKDGDHSNNRFDNLQILCPNCHSQTDNFRAKNIRH